MSRATRRRRNCSVTPIYRGCGEVVCAGRRPEGYRTAARWLGDLPSEGHSEPHGSLRMTKLKTIGAIGALLLGTSTLALAQTNSTTDAGGTNSGTTMMGQPASPPQGGSHAPMAAPQNGPASRPGGGAGTTPRP